MTGFAPKKITRPPPVRHRLRRTPHFPVSNGIAAREVTQAFIDMKFKIL
jgi:hypothetical protein